MYSGILPHYIVILNITNQTLKQKMGGIHFYRHALYNEDLMDAYGYTISNVKDK